MALTKELLETLECNEEPLPKRLKIADIVLKSSEIPIQHREAVVLKWVTKNIRNDASLWMALRNLLSLQQFQELSKSDIGQNNLKFILHMIAGNIKSLERIDAEIHKDLFETLLKLIENKLFKEYFRHNFKTYCRFIDKILMKIDDVDMLLKFIKNEQMSRSFILEEEQVENFLNISVATFVKVIQKFNNNSDVFEEIAKIVEKVLFFKHFNDYKGYIDELFEAGEEKDVLLPKLVFRYLQSAYYLDCEYAKCTYRLIFHSFSNCYNNHFHMIHKFFLVILRFVGFDMTDYKNLKMITKNIVYKADQSLEILNDVLTIFKSMNSNASRIRNDHSELTLKTVLENILEALLNFSSKPNKAILKVLNSLILIEPRIMNDKHLIDVLNYILFSNNESLKLEYEQVMLSIFHIFDKLRKLDVLVAKLLHVLREVPSPSENSKEPSITFCAFCAKPIRNYRHEEGPSVTFTEVILKYFSHCVENLSSSQVTHLFKLFVLPLEGERTLSNIEGISALICCFLCSVRIAEHTVPKGTVKGFVAVLEEFKRILRKFGNSLINSKHNHVLMEAFLNMSYFWGELYVNLTYYHSNYVTFKKKFDNDWSVHNLTYLHGYLSKEQWRVFSERIVNFGEPSCQKLMQKLLVQKMKAILVFEKPASVEELVKSVTKQIGKDIGYTWNELLKDPFFVNHVLCKFDCGVIKIVAEAILGETLQSGYEYLSRNAHVLDSQIVTHALMYKTLYQIDKSIRSMKNESSILSTEIFRLVNENVFFAGEEVNKNCMATLLAKFEKETKPRGLLVTIDEEKFLQYLKLFQRFPVTQSAPEIQTISLIYLMALLIDLNASKLRTFCELLIRGIIQNNCENVYKTFQSDTIIQLIINNFDVYTETIAQIFETGLKKDENVVGLKPAIDFICENIKTTRCMNCAVIFLQSASKYNKLKHSVENKSLLTEYRERISERMIEFLTTSHKFKYTDAYALILKTCLSKNAKGGIEKLLPLLDKFVDQAFKTIQEERKQQGNLLLFTTILHYKSQIPTFEESLTLKLWNECKFMNVTNAVAQEYLQFVALIFTHISNDDFPHVTSELKKFTVEALKRNDCSVFGKYVNIWICVLACRFNPQKLKLWHNALQSLLEEIVYTLAQNVARNELLHEHIVELEVNVIQTKQLILTSAMTDLCLLTIPTLGLSATGKECSSNFVTTFKHCFRILKSLLMFRSAIIMDRLPSFLAQYRHLVFSLCEKSNAENTLDELRIQELCDCSHDMEKLTKILVVNNRHMGRIAMFVVADILKQYEQATMYAKVKMHLDNCVYSLISLLDDHAVAYLLRVLSTSSAELFKVMHENYKKYYKFTGKV